MAALQWDSGGKTDPAVVRLERAGSGESEGRVGGGGDGGAGWTPSQAK